MAEMLSEKGPPATLLWCTASRAVYLAPFVSPIAPQSAVTVADSEPAFDKITATLPFVSLPAHTCKGRLASTLAGAGGGGGGDVLGLEERHFG